MVAFELREKEGEKPFPYKRFFDVLRDENDDTDRPFHSFKSHMEGFGDPNYSCITHRVTSRAKALAFIDAQSRALDKPHRAVPAGELSDAPQPPDGVERWYAVRQVKDQS